MKDLNHPYREKLEKLMENGLCKSDAMHYIFEQVSNKQVSPTDGMGMVLELLEIMFCPCGKVTDPKNCLCPEFNGEELNLLP